MGGAASQMYVRAIFYHVVGECQINVMLTPRDHVLAIARAVEIAFSPPLRQLDGIRCRLDPIWPGRILAQPQLPVHPHTVSSSTAPCRHTTCLNRQVAACRTVRGLGSGELSSVSVEATR